MKTKDELMQLARDVIQNKVFMANTPERVDNCFAMVLGLMSEKNHKEFWGKKPAALYEEYCKAGPRTVNNYPQFFSLKWLSLEEYTIFNKYWQELNNALQKVKN